MSEKLQKKRFEYKYRISRAKALEVSYFVRQYLDCDAYGATQPDRSYPVYSLYLDSPTLKTYHDTINGNRNRFKLRIRYYESSLDSPVYLEIKRRYDKVIRKSRAQIDRKYLPALLGGQMPSRKHLVSTSGEQLNALEQFCYLMNQINARSQALVRYDREAYERPNTNRVRVTFDRNVRIENVSEVDFSTSMKSPTSVFGDTVILEVKFTDRYPDWLQELIERYHLWRESAAKYVDGTMRLKGFTLEQVKNIDYQMV
ncbi:polyphosphate polymerase domain-containing protein [Aliifodinibius sp. S!AR15-10]|uniref:polyphosphate polymerase domain-containing protein n=1 Tax=Aliifodinibius sp. S!AR15-10 TaxID=2950437 RepID=UPI0028582BAC|nr:polyphosphate polymerase domain-containing protein [Aliifodinibius sp. S!AR15-10]MDR8393327.1 polyphosphate polymerase domain-containing protein [Aliifodinibius sp. S!AR15-10]